MATEAGNLNQVLFSLQEGLLQLKKLQEKYPQQVEETLQQERARNMPIEQAGFSKKALDFFRSQGLWTLGDVAQKGKAFFGAQQGLGPKKMNDIQEIMKSHGLPLLPFSSAEISPKNTENSPEGLPEKILDLDMGEAVEKYLPKESESSITRLKNGLRQSGASTFRELFESSLPGDFTENKRQMGEKMKALFWAMLSPAGITERTWQQIYEQAQANAQAGSAETLEASKKISQCVQQLREKISRVEGLAFGHFVTEPFPSQEKKESVFAKNFFSFLQQAGLPIDQQKNKLWKLPQRYNFTTVREFFEKFDPHEEVSGLGPTAERFLFRAFRKHGISLKDWDEIYQTAQGK